MWNDNNSSSNWACKTGKCAEMKIPIIIVIILLVIGWLFLYSNNTSIKEELVEQNTQDILVENTNSENIENTNSENIANTNSESIENVSVKIENKYREYWSDLLVADKTNVLFFAASWCPSCKSADKNFSTETIPDNINLLKVDYDKYSDLKEKYSVTMQHTFVIVDKDWNEIKKWSWASNVADLVKKL